MRTQSRFAVRRLKNRFRWILWRRNLISLQKEISAQKSNLIKTVLPKVQKYKYGNDERTDGDSVPEKKDEDFPFGYFFDFQRNIDTMFETLSVVCVVVPTPILHALFCDVIWNVVNVSFLAPKQPRVVFPSKYLRFQTEKRRLWMGYLILSQDDWSVRRNESS